MLANIRTAWRLYFLLKHVANEFYIKTENKSVLNKNYSINIYRYNTQDAYI
jgi:hypothetical protein